MESNKIFVVSAGRCGSRSIAIIFDQLEDVRSVHEPATELFDLAFIRAYGAEHSIETTEDEFLRLLKARRPESRIQAPHFLESAMWHTWLIDDLVEVFPGCKFIWLTRNIFSWAHSCFRRGWYKHGGVLTAMSILRPEPAGGWPKGDLESRWFKLGWMYGIYWNVTWSALKRTGASYVHVSTPDLNNLAVLNTLRRWCGFPGRIQEGAWKNKGNAYATEAELREWKLWDKTPERRKIKTNLSGPNALYDLSFVPNAMKDRILDASAFKGLTAEQADAVTSGLMFAMKHPELEHRAPPSYAAEAIRKHKIALDSTV